MNGFGSIADDVSEEPCFHLLYVGQESAQAEKLLESVREGGCFERVVAAAPEGGDLASVDALAAEAELYSGTFRGCLVVVWDLDGLGSSGQDLAALRPQLEHTRTWSSQVIAFGLTSDAAASFLELTDLLTCEVADLGDAAACRDALRRWCAPGDGALGLRASFSKTPSGWLRLVKHDYLNGGVLSAVVRPALAEAGLEASQTVIDYWQNAARNVLVHTRSNVRARAFNAQRLEDEPEIARTIARASFQLVVPEWLCGDLRALGAIEGEGFVPYATPAEAAARAAELGERGDAAVLLWEGSPEPPRLEGPAGGPIPTVLVGRDEPPRADWPTWRRLFARNVLGGFSRDELLARGPRGPSILEAKPSCWRPFCFTSLAAAVDEIRDRMLETYLALRDRVNENKKKKLYRSVAEIEAAREQYFGPPAA